MVGIAQQEGLLSIRDKSSKWLGAGWTSCPVDKENLITVRHQLTMTSGLNDGVTDPFCTDAGCLQCLADPGTRWAYHNAPYTL
jgi:CubicO group peptidase (beta-lactamase class C family)